MYSENHLINILYEWCYKKSLLSIKIYVPKNEFCSDLLLKS